MDLNLSKEWFDRRMRVEEGFIKEMATKMEQYLMNVSVEELRRQIGGTMKSFEAGEEVVIVSGRLKGRFGIVIREYKWPHEGWWWVRLMEPDNDAIGLSEFPENANFGAYKTDELRSNRPYLVERVVTEILKYNPRYGNDRICVCTHPYYRHFDSCDGNEPVGCKYCECPSFEEDLNPVTQLPCVCGRKGVKQSHYDEGTFSYFIKCVGCSFTSNETPKLKDAIVCWNSLQRYRAETSEFAVPDEFLTKFVLVYRLAGEKRHQTVYAVTAAKAYEQAPPSATHLTATPVLEK